MPLLVNFYLALYSNFFNSILNLVGYAASVATTQRFHWSMEAAMDDL